MKSVKSVIRHCTPSSPFFLIFRKFRKTYARA
jgi:hypothetical protein